ncbi:histidine phosphatase family protein [Nocardioides sp. SR21]|uniref:histidine phosphatase family protein n=1 Tax=Nocardioides sp. SR21 TaxID=2919501 RepID=UPI001FAA7D9A|nr:histidine phosphatase family protein [Nocardioides sp. SR21]
MGSVNELWLVRHGRTEWSAAGKHTSRTDVPLLPEGEDVARSLGPRLADVGFVQVLTSPRARARRTAELAGFADATVDGDLVEWDYGEYEGITTPEIRETVPGWTIWSHPAPGGETSDQVRVRLDRVVERARSAAGPTLAFGHGHALRALAARWLELPVAEGQHFQLDTATVSVLGWEHEAPTIRRWNA